MVPDPKLTPNPDAALRFLFEITKDWDDLGEPVMIELRCLMPDRMPDISRFSPDKMGMEMLVEHAFAMNATGLNIYPVINPVRASAPIRRDGKLSGALDEDIVAAFFFWADGDDEEAANSIRNFAGPKHTMAVMTGVYPSPRPHIYWRCEDGPIRNLEAWTGIQRSIAARLSTDRSVVNPSRIMRLPGTINWPTAKKAARGRIPELTTFRTEYDDDRTPVTFDQMLRVFGGKPAEQPKKSFEFDDGSIHSKSADDYADILRRARTDGEKHTGVRDLAASLAGAGVPRAMAEAMVREACPVWDQGVEKLIQSAYEKFTPASKLAASFDHPAGATPDAPPAWEIQTAADFTAGFVAPEYVIDGIVQRGKLYTLTAPTGSGKTAVMLYAATAIGTGLPFCEREVEGGDVLFMAGENPDDVRARVIATMTFYGIDANACRLHFIPGTFSIRQDMQRLKEKAEQLPDLMLVVVDTFAAYYDGDDGNNNAQILDFTRVLRKMTQFGSKPTVVIPAHPVKNAARDNLTPMGGSSLLNEVDGNLCLWNKDGIVSLHWQGKFRGADFEPLQFELDGFTHDRLRDHKGRLMPTVLAKPLLQLRAIQIGREAMTKEEALLLSIRNHPGMSIADRCVEVGLLNEKGEAMKSSAYNIMTHLESQKLIKKKYRKWVITADGNEALEEILTGQVVAEETAL